MLPLRSQFQPKRSPSSAFEASPVIFPPTIAIREEIKKVIIQRLTPVLAVIWLRSFCAVTLRSKTPSNTPSKKKLQKVRLWPKMKKEKTKMARSQMSHRVCQLKKKNEETRFLLVSSRTRAMAQQAVCCNLARNQFKSGAKRPPLVNPGQQCVSKMLIIAKLRAKKWKCSKIGNSLLQCNNAKKS